MQIRKRFEHGELELSKSELKRCFVTLGKLDHQFRKKHQFTKNHQIQEEHINEPRHHVLPLRMDSFATTSHQRSCNGCEKAASVLSIASAYNPQDQQLIGLPFEGNNIQAMDVNRTATLSSADRRSSRHLGISEDLQAVLGTSTMVAIIKKGYECRPRKFLIAEWTTDQRRLKTGCSDIVIYPGETAYRATIHQSAAPSVQKYKTEDGDFNQSWRQAVRSNIS
ncbi:MAG: hypothetical protein J3Q66DRAFT_397672 [Benniella sp.]|nr:MAG: hypothetical protein J3Q66DRAFT_397672 [Benniella sp.]